MVIQNFIPFLFFTILFWLNKRRIGSFWAMSNYILMLYMFSTLSFFILSIIRKSSGIYWNIEALLLISLPTFLLVQPLSRIESKIFRKKYVLEDIKLKPLQYLSWSLIVISFISIFFFLQNIRQLFVIDINDLRSGHGALYQGGTLISKISCFGAYLFPVTLFVYFYNIVKRQMPHYITLLLLVSSLSFIVYTLNVAGRDGIVLWFLYYLGYYSFFRFFIKDKDRRGMTKFICITSVIAFPLFLYISSSRFSGDSEGTIGSIVSYCGQSLYNLSQNIDAFNSTGYGALGARDHFELLYRVFDLFGDTSTGRVNRFEDANENIMFLRNLGYTPFSFSFYIGSIFPLDVSLWGLFSFICVFYLVCLKHTKINGNTISTKHLICSFSWYTILFSGIFYFYNGTFIGNFFLFFSLFIPFLL